MFRKFIIRRAIRVNLLENRVEEDEVVGDSSPKKAGSQSERGEIFTVVFYWSLNFKINQIICLWLAAPCANY